MKIYIYTLSDSRNPEEIRYVGKTINPHYRKRQHISNSELKFKNRKCNWIRKVVLEGGDIIMSILEESNSDTWVNDEKYWISQMKAWGFPLTNYTAGGEGECLTETEIAKRNAERYLRASRLKVWEDKQESRRRIKAIRDELVNKASQETKDKLSAMRFGEGNNFFGKKHTKESLEKIGMNHPFRRAINQYDLESNLLNTYNSSHEAEEKTGITRSTISRACKSEKPSKGGFIWKYVE